MRNGSRRIGLAPPLAACVAACVLCAAAAGAAPSSAQPASQAPAQQNARPASRPASQPASQPASRPAPAAATEPVRSQIGQTAIRDSSTPTTATASADDAEDATDRKTAPAGFDISRVVGALAVVLGLIFALRWVLRRSIQPAGMPGATNVVQVLTRSPLSPRQQLLLVRVGRRLIVVADCNGQLSALSELTDPDEVAALVGQLRDEKLSAASHSFGNLLGRLRRGADERMADGDGGAEDESFPRVPHDMPELARERREGRDAGPGDAEDDAGPSVASAQDEIQGLMERVRVISNQFRRP